MSRRTTSMRTIAACAAGVIACVVGLVLQTRGAITLPRGHGFVRTVCGEPATERVVREPVLLEGERSPRCVEHRAFYPARGASRLQLMLDTNGRASVTIDGRELLAIPEGERATRYADRRLDPGVHEVVVRFERSTEDGTLRLYFLELLGPYGWGMLPLQENDWYATREDAERGLLAPREPRSPLATALALGWIAIAITLVFVARRTWRGEALPARRDLAAVGAVVIVAAALRVPQALDHEVLFDEFAYWKAGAHYVRNALITGDLSVDAWRWNLEHPPIAKWMLGFGDLYGGLPGARLLASLASVASVGLLYAIARMLWGARGPALAAALVFALVPRVVGYARICALEDFVLFFTTGCLAAMVAFFRTSRRGRPVLRDALPLVLSVVLAVLGTNARATTLWVLVPAFVLWVAALRTRGARAAWSGTALTLVAAFFATGIVLLGWRYLWEDPIGRFGDSVRHFADYVPTEWYLGEAMSPPGRSYFVAAFLATTPEPVLLSAAAGAALLAWRRQWLPATFLALCVAAPFLQSVSHLRHDIDRYVVQAWCGVALLAGYALAGFTAWLRVRRGDRRRWLVVGALPLAIVCAHETLALARVEPYPLSYFNDVVGGPAGVAAARTFELTAWGHGVREAIEHVNDVAPRGATVQLRLRLAQSARLRDDLREVGGAADFIVVHTMGYDADDFDPGPRCREVHRVDAGGATLARVHACGE